MAALLAGPFAGAGATPAQATDLTSLTIAEASARLRSREITPLLLANAYLARIATLNGELNAYVTVTAASRRARSAVTVT